MKLFKVSATFLAIFLLNSTFCTNLLLENLQSHGTLQNNICKIAKDILKSTNDTQDVMIGNLESTTQPSIINDLVACMETSHPVVISDFKQRTS